MNLCQDALEDLSGVEKWDRSLALTVPASTVYERIEKLQDKKWRGHVRQGLLVAFDGLEGDVPVSELEDRLENLTELIEGIDANLWSCACVAICPEAYAEPRQSKKSSAAIPGSFSKMWRLSERAKHGLSLFHPLDSHGVAKAKQMELFA